MNDCIRETWRRLAWLGVVATSAGLLGISSADEAKARQVIDAMTNFYRELPAVEVRSELALIIGSAEESKAVRQTITQTMRLERPGRYALISEGQSAFLTSPSAYVDGGKATLILPGQGRIEQDGLASAEAMLLAVEMGFDAAAGGNLIFDQNLALTFLHKLLFAQVGRGWEEDLSRLRYVGEETIGEEPVHHLLVSSVTAQFGERELDLHLWVRQGERPLLLKLEPDLSKLFPGGEGEGEETVDGPGEIGMVNRWSAWDVEPGFEDGDFRAPKPAESEKVFPSFDALMHGQMTEKNPALTLTGNEAAAFSVALLDKGKGRFTLGDHRDQAIVVLGLWTTWADPEAEWLKALGEVQASVADEPVRFLAVSLAEDPVRVQNFLDEKKLAEGEAVPVGLDPEQKLVAPYKVRSIPQTVVVGRDGEVKQVHLGIDAAFARELKEQLALLLGKTAAPGKLP